VGACQQADQVLPFDLDPTQGAVRTIGAAGGTISVPPTVSLEFPAGALSGSTEISLTPRIVGPFPSDAGLALTGTAFDVGPAGTTLAVPAKLEVAVDSALLALGDEVRLSVAMILPDGTVETFGTTYDITNGILTADIDRLGPIAVVVTADAIALLAGNPALLNGGSFPPPPTPSAGGAALVDPGTVLFASSCAPGGRLCFSSGIVRVWADSVVHNRLGDDLFLLSPSISASFTFTDYVNGLPTGIVGDVQLTGDLRSRINSSVSNYDLESGITTGPTSAPTVTGLTVSGNLLTLDFTATVDDSGEVLEITSDEIVEFDIKGIGTTEQLTVEVEADIEFENAEGPPTKGRVIAHLRLRRQ
jgi:hypothetical protein